MKPYGFKGEVRRDLAPTLSAVAEFRDGGDTAEYAVEYAKIIRKHDLDALAKELDGRILLCHCSKDEFCHRLLLGFYLRKKTGIEVMEIGGFGKAWKELEAAAKTIMFPGV